MATMNISLPEPMKAWGESRSQGEAYANSSDYVRDLIRRDPARMAVAPGFSPAAASAPAWPPPDPFRR